MDALLIHGGNPLVGEVRISGAKNAALPILTASLLTAESLQLDNVPQLKDISTMLALLGHMGVRVTPGRQESGQPVRRSDSATRKRPTKW